MTVADPDSARDRKNPVTACPEHRWRDRAAQLEPLASCAGRVTEIASLDRRESEEIEGSDDEVRNGQAGSLDGLPGAVQSLRGTAQHGQNDPASAEEEREIRALAASSRESDAALEVPERVGVRVEPPFRHSEWRNAARPDRDPDGELLVVERVDQSRGLGDLAPRRLGLAEERIARRQ